MRSRIRRRGFCFLGVLVLGCVVIGGQPALAGSAQEVTTERPADVPGKVDGSQPQPTTGTPHAPEIDASSIPTALALVGASVLILRARLRSR